MKIQFASHDTFSIIQCKISTPKGEIGAETTGVFLEVDVLCDEKLVGVQYRYLNEKHEPASDWIVQQKPSWSIPKPSKQPHKNNPQPKPTLPGDEEGD